MTKAPTTATTFFIETVRKLPSNVVPKGGGEFWTPIGGQYSTPIDTIVWGWILGPIGMLLAVPLTMMVKRLLETSDDTIWLARFLGKLDEASQQANTE